jgi:hypothetical protein
MKPSMFCKLGQTSRRRPDQRRRILSLQQIVKLNAWSRTTCKVTWRAMNIMWVVQMYSSVLEKVSGGKAGGLVQDGIWLL